MLSLALVRQNTVFLTECYEEHEQAVVNEAFFLIKQSPDRVGRVRGGGARPNASHGIMLSQIGADNWCHWLIGILPSAFLAERLPEKYATSPLCSCRVFMPRCLMLQAGWRCKDSGRLPTNAACLLRGLWKPLRTSRRSRSTSQASSLSLAGTASVLLGALTHLLKVEKPPPDHPQLCAAITHWLAPSAPLLCETRSSCLCS